MAGRTYKEWVSDNIEHVKQQQKDYREANKEPRAQIKECIIKEIRSRYSKRISNTERTIKKS